MKLYARSVLQRKSSRFFISFLPLCLLTSWTLNYTQARIIHPSEWYYFTTKENHADIRSDDFNSKVNLGWPDEKYKICFEDNHARLPKAQYKSVLLCNVADLSEAEFKEEVRFFKQLVDKDYQDYYFKYLKLFTNATLTAIAAWVASIAAFRVYKWIIAGSG